MRHDRAIQAQIIWGANLIPSGPRAAVTIRAASRRVRARRPIVEGSDGGALATPGRGRWELRRQSAAAVRFENSKQKARSGSFRAGFAIFVMVAPSPATCRHANRFQVLNELRKIRRKGFDKLKLPSVSLAKKTPLQRKRPPLMSVAGCDICDDVNMHLICPTRQ